MKHPVLFHADREQGERALLFYMEVRRQHERRATMKRLWFAMMIAVLAMGGVGLVGSANADKTLQIADGMKVTMEYTLTLPDKTVADSTAGQAPFSYTQGVQEIPPGLEKELAGLRAGEKKHFMVPAAEAYGPYDETKKLTVPKKDVPQDVRPGMNLHAPNGVVAKVLEVNPDSVVVDINHPLAGKDLTFDVNIINVEQQTK